ncbi:AcrR family transcriptional regulator [Hydrogenophaga palleronii]|uniref:AcrR family transcriptional regulator n=1 Tax=Hydrogenophaga palleronii TaxID=65655 RepID=A0ABU1WPU5_9BURK|nr:TetR/AcrR family transcriptional regulator [Hydrogenophaga palleronii]MDR7151313.1 AcrR family transcriptional regulator [Hydrogenophaga palleronii]
MPSSITSHHESSTRQRIVEAADALFYQRGFEKTSFADIAGQVKLSRGNFYHHFKTKDEILSAVIELRAAHTQAMLEHWTASEETPMARLGCFAEMLIRNRKDIQRYGCPVGTLCAELAKLEHPAHGEAGMIFGQFRHWLREQFMALGRRADADVLAMHLLSRSQGIASLANAFHDETFIRREVAQIHDWLLTLHPEEPAARRRAKTSNPPKP